MPEKVNRRIDPPRKNMNNITRSSISSGEALIDIGEQVSIQLLSEEKSFLKMSSDLLFFVPLSDIVDLQEVSEETALKICILLGYTDEEMLSLLRRREELEKE